MTTLKDIYWLAGLLEGEGSFYRGDAKGKYPVINLKMNDLDVVERAQSILRPVPYRKNGNAPRLYIGANAAGRMGKTNFYVITIHGNRAAAWMMTLYPLMGERRRGRIGQLLASWREK